jgi:hypothetical protein
MYFLGLLGSMAAKSQVWPLCCSSWLKQGGNILQESQFLTQTYIFYNSISYEKYFKLWSMKRVFLILRLF